MLGHPMQDPMGSPRHRVWPTGDTQFTCVFFSVLSVWGSPECHLPHYSPSNSEGRAPTRVPVILTSRPLFSHVFGHVVLTECLAVLVLGGSQGREAEGLVRGGASLPSAGPSMADRKVANHGPHLCTSSKTPCVRGSPPLHVPRFPFRPGHRAGK